MKLKWDKTGDKHNTMYTARTGGLNGREMYMISRTVRGGYVVRFFGNRGWESLDVVSSPNKGKRLALNHAKGLIVNTPQTNSKKAKRSNPRKRVKKNPRPTLRTTG